MDGIRERINPALFENVFYKSITEIETNAGEGFMPSCFVRVFHSWTPDRGPVSYGCIPARPCMMGGNALRTQLECY
jgi:hypothetical protein